MSLSRVLRARRRRGVWRWGPWLDDCFPSIHTSPLLPVEGGGGGWEEEGIRNRGRDPFLRAAAPVVAASRRRADLSARGEWETGAGAPTRFRRRSRRAPEGGVKRLSATNWPSSTSLSGPTCSSLSAPRRSLGRASGRVLGLRAPRAEGFAGEWGPPSSPPEAARGSVDGFGVGSRRRRGATPSPFPPTHLLRWGLACLSFFAFVLGGGGELPRKPRWLTPSRAPPRSARQRLSRSGSRSTQVPRAGTRHGRGKAPLCFPAQPTPVRRPHPTPPPDLSSLGRRAQPASIARVRGLAETVARVRPFGAGRGRTRALTPSRGEPQGPKTLSRAYAAGDGGCRWDRTRSLRGAGEGATRPPLASSS